MERKADSESYKKVLALLYFSGDRGPLPPSLASVVTHTLLWKGSGPETQQEGSNLTYE